MQLQYFRTHCTNSFLIYFIQVCYTNDEDEGGADPYGRCKFPWTYAENGITYNGCKMLDGKKPGFWCPTELNDDDIFEPKSGKWGYCSDNCRKEGGKELFVIFKEFSQFINFAQKKIY